MNEDSERFHIVDDRGRELTRLNVDLMMYYDTPLSEYRDRVIDIMEAFYRLCPKEKLAWYATETMTQFKPATKRSYALPSVWWKDGNPRAPLRELKLKGGASHDSVATCGIYLSSAERTHRIFPLSANYLRFTLPAEFVETEYERLVDFAVFMGGQIPFVSGHGGHVIEINPYFTNDAETAAYRIGMRFQAVDIATMNHGPWAVRGERIKNVGWLTLIGEKLLSTIGGFESVKAKASNRLSVMRAAHGAVIRAGEKPILGDVNRREDLRAYIDAYRLVEPLQAGVEMLFPPFDLPGDTDGIVATARWLFRFRKGA
jgi:TseV toxin immunity protein TsiV